MSSSPDISFAFFAKRNTVRKLVLHCGLDHLPEELRFMTAIQELYLDGNPLTDLPRWIAELPSLQTLVLGTHPQRDYNLITEFPAVFRPDNDRFVLVLLLF